MSSEATLTRRLSQGTLTLEETLQYGLSLAQAVRSSHERGKALGNLHPDRIGLNGNAVRLLGGEPAGELTPYLAPEQVQGQPPDARSDVFAFGAILQEMLTGHRAFPARNEEELKASLLEAKASPAGGVRPEQCRLIARCLEKDPSRRWQRAGALVIELKLAAAGMRHSHQASELTSPPRRRAICGSPAAASSGILRILS